jgi:1-acyl-sn-glycerol-3-phosphate acyltransferase
MAGQSKFYRRCYYIANFLFRTFYRLRVVGLENINDGAAIICANHSSLLDPIFIAVVMGKNLQLHFIGKVELFRTPFVSWLVKGLGAISVDRSKADIGTVKAALNYLKMGKKVGIFPEGTRAAEDNVHEAKLGAIKIAERAGTPIIPVNLPRKKPLFSKVTVVIGEPYIIQRQKTKRTSEDYEQLSNDMMNKIAELGLT